VIEIANNRLEEKEEAETVEEDPDSAVINKTRRSIGKRLKTKIVER